MLKTNITNFLKFSKSSWAHQMLKNLSISSSLSKREILAVKHVLFVDYVSVLFYCAYDTKNAGFFPSR